MKRPVRRKGIVVAVLVAWTAVMVRQMALHDAAWLSAIFFVTGLYGTMLMAIAVWPRNRGARDVDAMRVAARTEGMVTDPVYEGKSMAALIDLVARGEIAPDATVLYAHLGGQPALNAYSGAF